MSDADPESQALTPLMGSMLDAVVAVDPDGVVIGWNRVATSTFGWTEQEAVGRLMGELIVPPQHRQAHADGMRRYARSGEARVLNQRLEISAIDKAGREFPVELSIVRIEAGPPGFVGFLRDISDRRQAAARLVLSEESLRLTTDAAEIGTWDLDLRSMVLTWSDRTKAMFGIGPAVECSMDDFYAGLHPDDLAVTSAAFAAATDENIRGSYDVQYRTIGREDGVVRWVAAKGKGIFDDEGRCIRAVGTAIDITQRKVADARHAFMLELSDRLRESATDDALRSACEFLGRTFGVSRTGYGQLDPVEDVFDYSICWTDGLVPPLLGRLPAHAFGRKIVAKLNAGETVVVGDLQTDPLSDEAETRATAASVDTRAILVVPLLREGRLQTIVYLNDSRIRNWSADEVGLMQEVAERARQVIQTREAEEALKALNASLEARVRERTEALVSAQEALRQSQKMEAIGQLTGGIAHDFNNLLQGISGSISLVRKRLAAGRPEDLERLLSAAASSADRAAALTHRLLAFARRQPLAPRPVPANPLIRSMEDLLRRTLGEQVSLELALGEDLRVTSCDPNQLENAILNVAINARDAMPDGGHLVIATQNWTANDPGLSGEYVSISVSDTGVGMDADTIKHAFEPFFTTKPMGQGTGLGLSMVHGFAHQSGGHVRMDSTVGEGTVVTLLLPVAPEAGDQPADAAEPSEAAAGAPKSISILVVEDEEVVRAMIVELLREKGHTVMEAADGPAGLGLLQSSQAFDLLVTDIGLPGLNGRQVADAARALRPDLKVLFMTGYAETAAIGPDVLDGGMAMITKPFSWDAFDRKVAAVTAKT